MANPETLFALAKIIRPGAAETVKPTDTLDWKWGPVPLPMFLLQLCVEGAFDIEFMSGTRLKRSMTVGQLADSIDELQSDE